jgi:pimeloyl-ACP methyl ester carboxylesterase
MNARPNIVLVHGAWADGSSWSAVIGRLQANGYHVTAPQFPMTALADDVARLRQLVSGRSSRLSRSAAAIRDGEGGRKLSLNCAASAPAA